MELLDVLKITATVAFIGFVGMIIQMCESLIWKPKRLRSYLRKQGIRGPPPVFLIGNIGEFLNAKARTSKSKLDDQGEQQQQQRAINHNCYSIFFPFFDQWLKQYGPTFLFSLGNIPVLHTSDPKLVKEITKCTSLDFGKPTYHKLERSPLLGEGVIIANGASWAHQKKILAPELYVEKVKTMTSFMVESSTTLVNSWKKMIESEDGLIIDVEIRKYMRSFSKQVISRACFGSDYSSGEEIFLTIEELEAVLSKKAIPSGISLLKRLPTKGNREIWRLEKKIRSLILNMVKERKGKTSENKDLLQMMMEAPAGSDSSQGTIERFIVDNTKSICLAAYETTAVTATWTMMLLASNPEWQDKVRAEVLEVCAGQLPDAEMIRKMKKLTMVILEALRLYPPNGVVSRETLQDMKIGDIHVPKGVSIWAIAVALHLDPEIWGPDASMFNPERFVNGVRGACTQPHVFMPFGFGTRICLGQHMAMTEIKVLIAILVANFSFTLSPKYVHSPLLGLLTEPDENGVNLRIKKL